MDISDIPFVRENPAAPGKPLQPDLVLVAVATHDLIPHGLDNALRFRVCIFSGLV